MVLSKRLCGRAAFAAALAAASGFFTVHAETCTATNVVVAPLTDAHWTQNAPYNDYSPKGKTVFTSGWEAGCVATAAAQELYYWQWPWRLDAVHETSHPVLNESNLSLRFDGNVPFDWESMQNSYGDGATLKQKHAAARLVLACQSLVQMRFVSGGGEAMKNLPGTMEWFEYAGQVTPRASEANLAALRSDFEWGSPVQTGINFKGYGGHEVVGLGYATGTNSVGEAKNLIWLNLGWGGGSDGWYDLAEATEGETIIKSVQLGFRPIKSVQIEPLAPVSGSSVTLNWHLPNCYTNKISGFTVAKKTPSVSTTTWTDDFSTGGKGRSSNTNEVIVTNERLYGWQGTASGVYTYDEVLLLTESSVLSYKYHDDYMAGMSVRVEAKIGDGAWQTISEPTLHGGWNYGAATTETVNLGAYAGKGARFRFVVEYVNASIWTTGVNAANVWFDDLSISNVKTFETVATDSTIAASARSATLSGLTTGETYAFTVTPIMSDNSAAVTQTATTTIGTPAAAPTINAVTMSPKGSNLVQEGFYADIAMGWNIIDVACSESVNSLEAFISHSSVLPQSKIEVVDNGSGSFSINIDATEIAAKWANQKMILTLKATNVTGESAYKDVELCLKASGVPENIPGGKVWMGENALDGEDYTAKWSGGLPSDGDKVTFLAADGEYGAMMNLNLSSATTLDYVYVTGEEQLTISGTSPETLTANILKNDIRVEINSSKFKVDKAIPSADILIDSGYSLDCEIDQSRSSWIKKATSGYPLALTDSSLWKGTVVFSSGYSADWLNPNGYGNNNSKVRLNGVAGYLAHSNPTFNPAIELVDDGSTPAFDWNNGAGASTATFKRICGTGTFKTSGSGATEEKIIVNNVDDFAGSFNLASKVVTIGTTKGTDASNGRLNFNSGYGATIAGGKTWTIGGGVYLAGNQTLTVNGTLTDSGALTAEGTGTVLSLAPTATVTAASLSFVNNTIRLAKTDEASPTFSVAGAAILTNATIEVALADGMSVGDSIALMSAGSFEGVDSATLAGLDGYVLEVSNGTLYATKPTEDESPVASAVWENDFGANACSEFEDYSVTDWQQTHGDYMSSVTIDRANQGLLVDFNEAKGYVTVLVKYSNLSASSINKRVLFATTPNSDHTRDRCGIRLQTDSKVIGLWNASSTANNDGDYGSASTGTVPSAGMLAFIYDKGTSGTSAYVAGVNESLPSTALWNNTALKGGDIWGFAVGGVCRDAAVNGVEAAQGMTISGLAVFDRILTAEEMNAYKWPSQLPPVDKDKYSIDPEVVWCKDFKTTVKGDYTLSTTGSTVADDTYGSLLTIGDAAATIDVRKGANGGSVTVLVKYRAAPNMVNAPVVTFGETLSNSVRIDVGAYTQSARTLAVNRSYNGGNNKWVALNTAASLNEGEGYLLCARTTNDMLVYVGDSIDNMTGGSTAAPGDISYSCDLIQAIGIGGPSGLPNADSAWSAFDGFVVEKIVVFNGYYTPDQIRYVENPEDGDTLSIRAGKTWRFAAGETRTYTNIGTLNASGTIAITNASELAEGTYTLATWTTPQQYTTQCAGYGNVGTLVTDGLAEGLSARLIYGARGIYLRVDDTAKQAARKPLVVWCYGDSITEGFNAQATGANYRILLYQKLEMLGYKVKSTGVYGLSNGYNSVDPTGTPLTDQYRWHSAKHGATAAPSSLSHRSNLSESVDTLAIQAGTPDVALLLIGVNDLPQFSTVEPVFKGWTNVVTRLVNNLPDTKIIVSTILYSNGKRGDDLDDRITDINENYIRPLMADMPEKWQGHVVLADLNSWVKSTDPGIIYSDKLHPDWWGYDQMADGYLDAIVKCYPDPDETNFPSQNPIPAAPTADQLGAANKPELAAYRAGFTKLCNIRVEKGQDVSNVVYDDVNGDAASDNLEKVGYFVEFVRDDNHAHKWVWVDMDAFGDADLASVGLPQRNYQQAVTRMHVCSNHGAIDNVAADDDSVTGWIEFSPYDYTRTGSNSAAPANYGDPFDWNDTLSESGSYGCMQVFRVMNPSSRDLYERPQLMFAFNNFQSQNSNPADFGIGNFAQHFNCNNSYHTEDWTGVGGTLAKMAPDAYSVKTIEIWTKENASAYSGPEPAAVWEDDFSVDALSEFDGFSIDDWQQTHGANMSSVTIDRANQGLLVDFTEAKGYVTVLVKYSNLAASSSNKRVLFATTANSDYTRDRCGIRLQTDSKIIGLWNASTTANNDEDYGNASTDTVPSAGTLAFVYDKTSGTDAGGVSAYVAASGESLPDSVLWSNHALKAGDIYGLAVGGMCRDAAVSGVEAAQGMTITGLAIFTNVLTVAEMNAYMWPSQLPPVDKEKYAVTPEAVWYKDFKTTAKTNDAGRVYTLAVSGTTIPADDEYGSTLTIGNAAAVIDGESAEALTVLVKYRAAPAIQSAPVVTFGGDAAVTFDSGICTSTTVDRQLAAYYSFIYNNNRMRGINAVDGNPTLSSDGGYLVCARKYNECLAYVGDSLDNMTGGVCTADMQISNSTLRKIGIGGQTELSSNDANMVPFTGFVVEKVVVFNGYYTPDEIRYVEIPEDADMLAIGNGKTWNFAAGTTRTYTNIGTLNTGGTIAITNAAELTEGVYPLATWTTAQKKSTGYGHVGTLNVDGLPAGLSAELVYGAKAIYLRVWDPATQAEKGTLKVWPYGDSITEGFNAGGTRANYRVLLAQKLSMLGFNVEMVGCYDKINGANGLDPSGQAIPDAWKWHSAKHGATAGPTTSAAGRANLCENVDTLCAQAGNPDVVLLLAGANDIVPATGLTATQVVASVTNIVAHLAANLPDTKIVIGNQINVEQGYNSGNYNHVTKMIPQVNALLKNYVDNLPEALAGKVFLADLNSYVKSGEYGILFDHGSDHLHPDWWGHDQMAEGWLSIVTNQFTSTQTFPSATIPSVPTSAELGAAAKAELADYRDGYTLCRTIDAASTNVPSVVTGEGATEGIEKVAYFVEYVRADNNAHKWVWVDMDAFGTTIGDVGLPSANHQQVVTKLHVKSNHNGIENVAANDDTVTGFIEFSPYDYNGNVSGVTGASAGNGDCCDWNDTLSESGSYGCMQVHRISPGVAADGIARGGQVLFAYNNWQSSSSAAEFGIGNFSSHFYRGANDAQTLDYTYTASATKMNASAYSVKRIEIWTKGATPAYVRDNIVKRADGTVYHGNDENRAIITNWQCQITRPAAPPAPNTIDILYVLDKPSREYIEGTKNMSLDEFFARETAFMNEMLCRTDMDTNFWFRMVGVYPLDVQAQEVSPMLGRCKNSSEPGFELVNEVRNRVGADIVFSVARNGGGIGGLAYVNSYENIVSGAAAPLGHACGFLEYYDMISWIHEIAHVMSCNHMPPANIDVTNPRHRQFGVVVHDDNATEAPFDYRTIMTGYYYAGQTWCFSSRNHYYNGVQLSVSNHVDATQVMVELAPYVAQWRPTKVPERPEISFFPQDNAEIPVGVETMVTIDYGDPEAEIYWYDITHGEGKEDAHLYTGPIPVVGEAWEWLCAFAKTNDVEVAGSEKDIKYFSAAMHELFAHSVVLDSDGIVWSMPLPGSSEFAWDKDTQIFCVGESSYQAHVDMESLTNSRPSTCSATALLTLTEARNLNFRHIDSYTNAMFSVWVDDVPVYYKKGASDTGGEWRKEVIRVESGTHRIEFVFTQTAEDMVDAQTSEGDEHALVDDEKYQRYIASLVAAETSRVRIDGFEWTPTDMIWAGDEMIGDGVWTTDITYKPWEGGVSFADDAVVTFPDLAAGSPTVAVKGVVRPSKVNFTGANTAYTFVPQDDNAFIYISNGSSTEFKTNAAIRVPFRLDAAYIRSAAKCTLELGNIFGHGLTGPAGEGSFWGQIGVGSKSTVIMNPGAGRVQTVGDFGKNWSYTDSDLVFTNGTVKVNGVINGGNGLFQYKRIHVKNGAVLELVTNDATGYDVAGNNTIEVERGGELKIDAGDRLRRPMKLSGGKLTVSRSGSVHALALYNNPSFTVTADSVLTNGNAAATLGFVGQDATITLQNNATLDCYVPFANGIMADDSKNVTIAGSGTFVQNTLMIQFTNKVTVANGVTFRQNAVTSGMVGKSSWDVNGTLEANAIMQVSALTLASGATLSVKVTDANVSNAAILCDATPSLSGSIVVNAASDLANGKYAVISATGLEDGLLARVSAPALAKRATFAVEEGGLFMTVADYTEGAFTDTSYPVPYSWMMDYYPSLRGNSSEQTELQALQPAASAAHSVWECYVLGLDPTNETSKFLATIRMNGTTPVVEYSPTNTALGNITYVLQGKPTLTNGWQDVEFNEPGDTNRFFRVKVTW